MFCFPSEHIYTKTIWLSRACVLSTVQAVCDDTQCTPELFRAIRRVHNDSATTSPSCASASASASTSAGTSAAASSNGLAVDNIARAAREFSFLCTKNGDGNYCSAQWASVLALPAAGRNASAASQTAAPLQGTDSRRDVGGSGENGERGAGPPTSLSPGGKSADALLSCGDDRVVAAKKSGCCFGSAVATMVQVCVFPPWLLFVCLCVKTVDITQLR